LDIYVHRKDGTPLPGIFIFEDKQYYCEICLRNWQSNLLFRFADWQSRNIQNALNYQNDTVEVETDQNGHAIITNVPPNLGALRYRTTHNSDSYFFLDLAHSKLIGNTLDWTVEK
jgi:hypothetical protein